MNIKKEMILKKFLIKIFLLIILLISFVINLLGCSLPTSQQQTEEKSVKNSVEKYSFVWSDSNDPYLKQLREEFKLDKLIEKDKTDLEKVKSVLNWVHNLWKHNGSNEPQKNDPISILHEVPQGKQFRCVEYGVVLSGCLNALGIRSRVLGLKTEEVETRLFSQGHVATEAYIKELNKWVFIDGQWGAIPTSMKCVPLNALEFRNALWLDKAVDLFSCNEEDTTNYLDWIKPYLVYFDVKLDNRYTGKTSPEQLMLVPAGFKKPTVFQVKTPIKNMKYTYSSDLFYP